VTTQIRDAIGVKAAITKGTAAPTVKVAADANAA